MLGNWTIVTKEIGKRYKKARVEGNKRGETGENRKGKERRDRKQ